MNLATAPIDDNTKLALQVGVALLGVVGVSIGAALGLCAACASPPLGSE